MIIHNCLVEVAIKFSKMKNEYWLEKRPVCTEDLNLLYHCYRAIPSIIANRIDSPVEFLKYVNSIMMLEEWKYEMKTVSNELKDAFLTQVRFSLTIEDYLDHAKKTITFNQKPEVAIPYLGFGVASESGEIANILKKIYRGDYNLNTVDKAIGVNSLLPQEISEKLILEIGDNFWYLTIMCYIIGYNPENVLRANIDKLAKRKAEGTLKSVDHRNE